MKGCSVLRSLNFSRVRVIFTKRKRAAVAAPSGLFADRLFSFALDLGRIQQVIEIP